MTLAALAFFAIFVLIATGGLLLFYREARVERLSALLHPGEKRGPLERVQSATVALGRGVITRAERLVPRSHQELGVMQQRLSGAAEEHALDRAPSPGSDDEQVDLL